MRSPLPRRNWNAAPQSLLNICSTVATRCVETRPNAQFAIERSRTPFFTENAADDNVATVLFSLPRGSKAATKNPGRNQARRPAAGDGLTLQFGRVDEF
jgi:hypothetical protein